MMPCGPSRLYSSVMSKCFPKAQGNGNISSEPSLHVFVDLTNPVWLSVHGALLLQSSQWLCSQTCLVWGHVTPK